MGIPDATLEKLYNLRQWNIPEDGPIPFTWPKRLRTTIWNVLRQCDTGEAFVPKQFQVAMAHHLARMPRFIDGDSVGLGKAQPLDAKILTPEGWVAMGDLRVGQRVIDPDGGTGIVEGIYPQGIRPVFKVRTSDGAETECCGEHLWTFQTAASRHAGCGWKTRTTEQLIAHGLHRTTTRGKCSRIFLPLTEPCEFDRREPLSILPYTMGALLGDGGMAALNGSVHFTSADVEILTRVQGELPAALRLHPIDEGAKGQNWRISQEGRAVGGNPYINSLKSFGLFGGSSLVKFIPEIYRYSDVASRIELVRGLMDTDGECSLSGLAYFHTSSAQLRNHFAEVVRSLGGFTRVSKAKPGTYRTKSGEIKQCAMAWSLTVQTPFNPFFLTRKASRWKRPYLARPIKSITPAGSKPTQCIRVSTKRHLYVTDGHIVTHNTIEAILATTWLMDRLPRLKVIVFTTKTVSTQWAEEFERFSTLRPWVMKGQYKKLKSYQARFAQLHDFLKDDTHDILICKYSSMIGKRRKVEGQYDENGYPVVDGRERISKEILQFLRILKPYGHETLMILDECQKFKTPGSQTRNMVQILSKPCGRVWALTATVIKNGLDEFYSTASAIGIRPLGPYQQFKEEFCIYRDVHIGGGKYKAMLEGYRDVPKFKKALRPFFLGRSQRQVKEKLPRLQTMIRSIELSEEQKQLLLEDIPSGRFELPPRFIKVHGELIEKERDPDNAMTMLSVYQLVANHPGLLDPANTKAYLTHSLSPKEEELLDLLDGDLRGEKVVIFTKSKLWINRLEYLTKEGYFTDRKFLRITGDESDTQRARAKQLFQEPGGEHDLIFINAAATEGVNLQQSAHLICLDIPWSFGDLLQLVGRILRLASPHSLCTLHILSALGTVDEYAIETQRCKKGVFEKILGESHSAGLLDDRDVFDLTSGMEQSAKDSEFLDMMRAHVKGVSLTSFTTGEQLQAVAKGTPRPGKTPKPRRDDVDEETLKMFGL